MNGWVFDLVDNLCIWWESENVKTFGESQHRNRWDCLYRSLTTHNQSAVKYLKMTEWAEKFFFFHNFRTSIFLSLPPCCGQYLWLIPLNPWPLFLWGHLWWPKHSINNLFYFTWSFNIVQQTVRKWKSIVICASEQISERFRCLKLFC